jgi:hypothetical protein
MVKKNENWLVLPEYSSEWLIMTHAQMVAYLNWTQYECYVKRKG